MPVSPIHIFSAQAIIDGLLYSHMVLRLESERVSGSTTATPPKSHFKLIAVIAIVAVTVIVGALVASAFILIPQPQGQDAWLFKGAYATYKGSASISAEDLGSIIDLSLSIDFTVRQAIGTSAFRLYAAAMMLRAAVLSGIVQCRLTSSILGIRIYVW